MQVSDWSEMDNSGINIIVVIVLYVYQIVKIAIIGVCPVVHCCWPNTPNDKNLNCGSGDLQGQSEFDSDVACCSLF